MKKLSELFTHLHDTIDQSVAFAFRDCFQPLEGETTAEHLMKAISLLVHRPADEAAPSRYKLAINQLLDQLFKIPLDADDSKHLERLFHLGHSAPRERPNAETKIAIETLIQLSESCSKAGLHEVFKNSLADVVNNFEQQQDAEHYDRIKEGFSELFVGAARCEKHLPIITPANLDLLSQAGIVDPKTVAESLSSLVKENEKDRKAKGEDKTQLEHLPKAMLKAAALKKGFYSCVSTLFRINKLELAEDQKRTYQQCILASSSPISVCDAFIFNLDKNSRERITDDSAIAVDIRKKIASMRARAGEFASAIKILNANGQLTDEKVDTVFEAAKKGNAAELAEALVMLENDPDLASYKAKIIGAAKPKDLAEVLIEANKSQVKLTESQLNLLAKNDSPKDLLKAIQITAEFKDQTYNLGFNHPDALLTVIPGRAAHYLAEIAKMLSNPSLAQDKDVAQHLQQKLSTLLVPKDVDKLKNATDIDNRLKGLEKIYVRLKELQDEDNMVFLRKNPASALETNAPWWGGYAACLIRIMNSFRALGVPKEEIDNLWLIPIVKHALNQKKLNNLPANLDALLSFIKTLELSDEKKKELGKIIIKIQLPIRVELLAFITRCLPQHADLIYQAILQGILLDGAGMTFLDSLIRIIHRLDIANGESVQNLMLLALHLNARFKAANEDDQKKFQEIFRLVNDFYTPMATHPPQAAEKKRLQATFQKLLAKLFKKLPANLSANELAKIFGQGLATATVIQRMQRNNRDTAHNTDVNNTYRILQVRLELLYANRVAREPGQRLTPEQLISDFEEEAKAIALKHENPFVGKLIFDYLDHIKEVDETRKNKQTDPGVRRLLSLLRLEAPHMADSTCYPKLLEELAIETLRAGNKGKTAPAGPSDEKNILICRSGVENRIVALSAYLHPLDKVCEGYKGGAKQFNDDTVEAIRSMGFGEQTIDYVREAEYIAGFRARTKENGMLELPTLTRSLVQEHLIQLAKAGSSPVQRKYVMQGLDALTQDGCDYEPLLKDPDPELLLALQAGEPDASPWRAMAIKERIFAIFMRRFEDLFTTEELEALKANMHYATELERDAQNSLRKQVEKILSNEDVQCLDLSDLETRKKNLLTEELSHEEPTTSQSQSEEPQPGYSARFFSEPRKRPHGSSSSEGKLDAQDEEEPVKNKRRLSLALSED